jgi:hypothetical protein
MNLYELCCQQGFLPTTRGSQEYMEKNQLIKIFPLLAILTIKYSKGVCRQVVIFLIKGS